MAAPRSDHGQATKRGMTLVERLYLPAVIKGLGITLRHILRPKVTVEYPEELPPVPRGSRGTHRLIKDELGRERCVACFLCASACPSRCITIVAEAAPPEWPDREKRPKVFDIDMLRCIFCGYCEEACPCKAIELTEKFYPVGTRREEFIWDKQRLLAN